MSDTFEGFPLSPQQEWLCQAAGPSVPDRAEIVARLSGSLDDAALTEAVGRAVARHEILRTTFPRVPGMTLPLQVIQPAGEGEAARLRFVDLSGERAEERFQEALATFRREETDVTAGPQLQILVARLAEGEHRLALALPALCADRQALEILLTELVAAYDAVLAGGEVEGEVLQYADLAEWQRALLESEEAEGLPLLAGRSGSEIAEVLYAPLPFEAAGPARPGMDAVAVPLAPGLAAGLERAAEEAGVEVEALLLAAWEIALSRVAGRRGIVGVTCGGRKYEGLDTAVGLLAKTLPVAFEVAPAAPLRDLAMAAQASLEEAWAGHEYFSPSRLPANAAVSGLPMIPCALDVHRAAPVRVGGGLEVETLRVRAVHDRFRLRLRTVLHCDRIEAEIEYEAGRYDRNSLLLVAARLARMLEAAASSTATPVDVLDLLTEAERHRLLVELNDTARVGGESLAAHRRFERAARQSPESPALVSGSSALSYGELDGRANRLASHLRGLGAGPGSLVGVFFHGSFEMVTAVLGVLKAGAAYLPLDPTYPTDRLAFMLADAGASILLTESGLVSLIPDVGAPNIVLVDALGEGSGAPQGDLPGDPESSDLAYVIYTSGSTGKPKGTLVHHAGLANYLDWCAARYLTEEGTGSVLHSSLGFDLTVTSLFPALAAGKMVHLTPSDVRGEGLGEVLRGLTDLSLVKITPAHLAILGETLPPGEAVGRTRLFVIGGEALRWEGLRTWRRNAPETRLVNEYGPTEAVVGCAVYEVRADDPDEGAVPIGHPIDNTRLYVLDDVLHPVPAGIPGELFIGGSGVARGYLGRPGLTAERFIPDGLSGKPGARLYRTGDLVRHRADGDLEFLGRTDNQVKLRGFRIELGEIESALVAHPAVREAVVVLRRETGGGERLVAYLTAREERPAADDLRRFLASTLPEHMLPSAFEVLPAWPLTVHGKVDRGALPEPSAAQAGGMGEYAPPSTFVEELLVNIWKDVLRLDRVGVHDNFFQLGGDSIRSIEILARCRQFGLLVSPQTLFQNPTVRGLSLRIAIDGSQAEGFEPTASFSLVTEADRAALPVGAEDAYPLTQLQSGMLFHSFLSSEASVYHEIVTFHLRAPFDAEALQRVLGEVIARHPVLRTSFHLTGYSEPLQVVHGRGEVRLEIADLSSLGEAEQEEAVAAWMHAESRATFEWAQPSLIRFVVHRRNEGTFQLSLSYHHSILDGWSVASLLSELFLRYGAALAREIPPVFPNPAATFRDFVAAERRVVESPEQQRFWRDRLADAEPLVLPRWRKPEGSAGMGVRKRFVVISAETAEGLARCAQAEQVLIKSVLFAAVVKVLGLLVERDDVLVGVVGHSRPQALSAEQIAGLFLNTLPLRLRLPAGSWSDLVRAAFTAELETLPHQAFPLAEIQRLTGADQLFEAVFNFVNFHAYQAIAGTPGLEVLGEKTFEETNFPLALIAIIDPALGQPHVRVEYDAALFADAEIELLSDYLGRAFTTLARDPAARHDAALLLSPAERHQALVEWNDTAAAVEARLFHEIVAARAAAAPTAPAVSGATGEGDLSYRELDERSAALSRGLRSLGVVPGVVVGLCVERGPGLLTGFLAILKAGGVYLPLDPAYPQERLAFILRDAGAELLITEPAVEAGLPPLGVRTVRLEDLAAALPMGETDVSAALPPDALAYVIYTSGSTGAPKGVAVTHSGLSNLVAAQRLHFGITPEERILQFASPSFDSSVAEIAMTLAAGASLVFGPREELISGPALAALIAKGGVTRVTFSPSVLAALEPSAFPSLRVLMVAGEACPAAVVDRWAAGRRFLNLYGPTEATVWASLEECAVGTGTPPIGRPVANVSLYVLDRNLQPVPAGVAAELCIGGPGVALGYLNRPDLTAERFMPDPWSPQVGARLYRTGDLARRQPDGRLAFLGRLDRQVKIRGFRIELGEIEAVLRRLPEITEAVVLARGGEEGESRLVAYLVGEGAPRVEALRDALRRELPDYMIPAAFVALESLPLTTSGKLDRAALPDPAGERPLLREAYAAPRNAVERAITQVWQEVLGLDRVGRGDNFFDLGGHSLLILRAQARLREVLGTDLPIVDFFTYPTVQAFAGHVLRLRGGEPTEPAEPAAATRPVAAAEPAIAVLGMAGRFPQAAGIEDFWELLRTGTEAVSFFSAEELRAAGVEESMLEDPRYVPAKALLDGVELFDAGFFGFTPREAEIMDPQQRLFLECAWEALEAAGHGKPAGQRIGVFAGASMNSYWFNLLANPEVVEAVGVFQTVTSNDKDFLSTRVSYKLGLTGPSLTVQTACSTSLVAVHTACQALRAGECDMALAGGVSVRLPQKVGYIHLEGGIDSPDGHCRAFDAAAQGTVGGNGVGVVVLKRLADAVADGDPIRAVIAGSAINNDGAGKVGFTAPSVDGQAQVIRSAQQMAGIEPRTISYVEAHGTGTPLGDPIEIAALKRAFAAGGLFEPGSCAIGSVKTNIGHLDAAAGVAGLIKTVLQLERRTLVPSLHFEHPNPQLGLAESPFRVSTALAPWEGNGEPLRAGVSSFGIGGTNAHLVLEEAPQRPAGSAARPGQLLVLSAPTQKALERMTANLAGHLDDGSEGSRGTELADVAYTLQAGRTEFPWRRMLVAGSLADAARALEEREPRRLVTALCKGAAPSVAFLFSGQGAQYPGMAAGLYRDEPRFRHWLDLCGEALRREAGLDLSALLAAGSTQEADAIHETERAQPALFAVEYALARFWMELGVIPEALLGHSVGELVAACLAGVFSLDDAIGLVAARGRLVQALPTGSMLAVALSEAEVLSGLPVGLALAAVNAPDGVVVSGPHAEVDRFERELRSAGVECRRLRTSHAFHSPMMEPALADFAARVAQVERRPPQIPFLSNVTGTWITAEQAADPGYWAAHLRSTVRFAAAVDELSQEPERLFLEVGPGHSLAHLVRRHPARSAMQPVLSSLRPASETTEDREALLGALGRLWLAGQRIDWRAVHAGERRLRIALPTYPFDRRRYWLEERPDPAFALRSPLEKRPLAQWFSGPSWRRSGSLPRISGSAEGRLCWVLADRGGVGEGLARALESAGCNTVLIFKGETYERHGAREVVFDSIRPEHYRRLLADFGDAPRDIVHCWSLDEETEGARFAGCLSLVYLAQALGDRPGGEPFRLRVVTRGAFEVTGDEVLRPDSAMLLGPTVVLPQEDPGFRTQLFDLAPDGESTVGLGRLAAAILGDDLRNSATALRGGYLWHQAFEPAFGLAEPAAKPLLRPGGVYLITGGVGRVGLALAERLAREWRARLVLVGRSAERAGLARIAPLLAAGAEVELVTADAADRGQMERALRRAEERFGSLHGVIHAAGEIGPQTFRSLQELDAATFARQLRAKVDGSLVLADLLANQDLDVCVLVSSLAGVLGGLGFTAYAAANAFLDTLAHRQSRLGGTPWLSLDWDAWSFPGDEGGGHAAITPAQGAEAFERALALPGARQILISVTDLAARFERSRAQLAPPTATAGEPDDEGASASLRPGISTDYVAPRNDTERRLAAIWRSLLGIGEVGVEDSFFELGGHSLLATQLLAKIRETFRVSLSFEDLFARPTVAGIAERLYRLAGGGAEPALPPLVAVPRDEPLPLSFAQQRLWLFQHLEPESAVYNVFSSFRLSGSLDLPALEAALAEIVRRHEVLRTVFREAGGVPFQVPVVASAPRLPVTDLTALPPARWGGEARERFGELARKPFDLARGPLFQPLLVRLGPMEHLMLLVLHHIVCDAWSVGVFNRELMALYESFSRRRPAALPALPVQYADYAVWQRRWLQGEVLEAQLAYWKSQLSGLTPIELPTDRPRPPRQTFRGATHSFALPEDLSASLRTLGQRENVTLFMLLLAGFQTLLFRYTGQNDIAVGTNVTNRASSDLEGLIGFFVNNLVLRCNIAGNPSFRSLLQHVRDVALEAYAHQDLPFERLVEEMQRDRNRDPSRPPLFQILFVLQNTPGEDLALAGLEVEPFEMASSRAAFDLLFNLYDSAEGLRGAVEYNLDLYEPATIARLCEYFTAVLRQSASDPDVPVESIELSGATAERGLIDDFMESFGVLA